MLTRFRRRLDDMKTMKQLFSRAEEAAYSDGGKPGAEHLVLAALDLPDGTARKAFEMSGADPDTFSTALEEQHAAALRAIGIEANEAAIEYGLPDSVPPTGPYRSEASAQALFQRVARMVKDDGSYLTGAHVVLAATTDEHGTTARTLRHLGVDPARLAEAARAEIETSLQRR
jgi:ATP-dependent Clp protease ATP-binding subunit ClpA